MSRGPRIYNGRLNVPFTEKMENEVRDIFPKVGLSSAAEFVRQATAKELKRCMRKLSKAA